MKKNYPYLNNPYYVSLNAKNEQELFLQQIDNFINLRQYIKITLLDWNENPIKEIQGELSGGTINKDGSSSIRRTASLSAIFSAFEYSIEDLNLNFSINKKVFIEIGVKNETDSFKEYPILWFPQGVFFISDFSCNVSATGSVSANISLKDKMMMLSGDIGGKFNSTTILDEMDTIDEETGEVVTKKVLLYNLILELVNHFGGELLENIVIEDVPERIKSIMKWTGDTPLYFIPQETGNGFEYTPQLKEPDNLVNALSFNHGEDVGYIYSDFVYDMELVANAGESVCSVLDKIKQYLGNYEYFYDEYGVFHFREIKNYLNTTQATTVLKDLEMNTEDYLVDISTVNKNSYTFSDKTNLISLNVTPQYGNIKNDYIVQGLRKVTGSDVSYPIYYHLAIDNKPIPGNTYKNVLFYSDSESSSVIKAGFPNQRFFYTGRIGEDEKSPLATSYYNNKKDIVELYKNKMFKNFIEGTDSNLKTIENLIADVPIKTGDTIYRTIKKEPVETVIATGDNLFTAIKTEPLLKEFSLTEKPATFKDYKNNHEKLFNALLNYGKINIKDYSREEEKKLKDNIGFSFGYSPNAEVFQTIFNFYLSAGLSGKYSFEEFYEKTFNLFLSFSEKLFGSFYNDEQSIKNLLYGKTFLLKDNEVNNATNLYHFYELEDGFPYASSKDDDTKDQLVLQADLFSLKRIFRKKIFEDKYLIFESKEDLGEAFSSLTEELIKNEQKKAELEEKGIDALTTPEAIEYKNLKTKIEKLKSQIDRDVSLTTSPLSSSSLSTESFYGMVQDVNNYSQAIEWVESAIITIEKERVSKNKEISEKEYIADPRKEAKEEFIKTTEELEVLTQKIEEYDKAIKEMSNNSLEKSNLIAEQAPFLDQKIKLKNLMQQWEVESKKELSELEELDSIRAKTEILILQEELNNLTLKKNSYQEKYLEYFKNKKEKSIEVLLLAIETNFMNPAFEEAVSIGYEIPTELDYMKEVFVFWNGSEYQELYPHGFEEEYVTKDWRTELYMQGLYARQLGTDLNTKKYSTDANFYFEELEAYWPTIYSLIDNKFYGEKEDGNRRAALCDGNYFLDFIEPTSSDLGEFCVSNIGRRQNTTCDDQINCLFAPEVPDLVLIDINDENYHEKITECQMNNQKYAQISSDIYWALSLGGHRNPAFDQIKYDLYLHTNYQKTISFSSRPVFYLEPNTRIIVKDYTTNTFGNFMLNNVSISLGASGTMSGNANEIFERF